jgi:hypothetical protein
MYLLGHGVYRKQNTLPDYTYCPAILKTWKVRDSFILPFSCLII